MNDQDRKEFEDLKVEVKSQGKVLKETCMNTQTILNNHLPHLQTAVESLKVRQGLILKIISWGLAIITLAVGGLAIVIALVELVFKA